MTTLRRAGRALAATVVLSTAVLPLALPGRARAATQLECIGVVVDPAGSGSPRAADTFCATVPYGATGAQVLAARAKALNRPQPRYQGGLLCAIDGYPTSGCGDPDPTRGGYDYWSYWHKKRGTTQWTYSGTGVDEYSPVPGDLEGWAFQEGGPEGARMPPDVSAESVCATARPAAAPTRSPATTTPPAPSKTPATTAAARGPAAKPSSSGPRPTARPSATATPPRRAGLPSATRPAKLPGAAAEPSGTPSPVATGAATSSVVAAAVPDATPVAHSRRHVPVGAIVAGVAVLALAAGAFARSRLGRR